MVLSTLTSQRVCQLGPKRRTYQVNLTRFGKPPHDPADTLWKCESTAEAWAPVQAMRDHVERLGNCLTVSQWVVMGFSNPEPPRRSPGVGRIVLTPLFPLEGRESIWHFFASGQELLTPGSLAETCERRCAP